MTAGLNMGAGPWQWKAPHSLLCAWMSSPLAFLALEAAQGHSLEIVMW